MLEAFVSTNLNTATKLEKLKNIAEKQECSLLLIRCRAQIIAEVHNTVQGMGYVPYEAEDNVIYLLDGSPVRIEIRTIDYYV